MPKGASVMLKPRGPRRKTAEVEAASPPTPVTLGRIVRLSPTSLSIESELLFDPDWEATAREFLIRVFAAAEVESVLVDASQARAEIRFHPEGDDPGQSLKALAEAFRKLDTSPAQAVTVADYLGRATEF